jgi:hypothetical protein
MTGETPVLGTLADLTVASVKHNCLAPRELMLARMAALIPADDRLPPISPTPRPPRRAGVTADDIQGRNRGCRDCRDGQGGLGGREDPQGLGLAIAVAGSEMAGDGDAGR